MAAALLLVALAPATEAQPVVRADERLAFDRPEAWAMRYYAAVSLASGFGVPAARRPGSLDLALEVGWIPSLEGEEARVGFRGTKQEDLDKAPLLARPRLTVGLPARTSLELGWVPPVDVFDAEPNLVTLALGRPLLEGGTWRAGARLHGQTGMIRSDITCPGEVAARGNDPDANPFGCEAPSRDEVHLSYYGVEVSTERDAGGAWVPYLGLGVSRLDLEFQVDAQTGGFRDLSRLTTSGSQWHAVAGLRWLAAERSDVSFEVFYSPLSVERRPGAGAESDALLNLRTMLRYRLR
ncbi:MAG TPA: hypothetical protein VM617_04175 [Thermoanaerobaculia bacterium]|nr:hypothetical protein [Thermoanaerobaculia bacterium]